MRTMIGLGADYQIRGGPIVRAVVVKAVRALHNTVMSAMAMATATKRSGKHGRGTSRPPERPG